MQVASYLVDDFVLRHVIGQHLYQATPLVNLVTGTNARLFPNPEEDSKMEDQKFAIVQWIDKFTSVINLDAVKHPRKPVEQYTEGEYVTALYGNKKYKARISEICDDRINLVAKKTPNGNYPLKFVYEDQEGPTPSERNVKRTAASMLRLDQVPESDSDTERQSEMQASREAGDQAHSSAENSARQTAKQPRRDTSERSHPAKSSDINENDMQVEVRAETHSTHRPELQVSAEKNLSSEVQQSNARPSGNSRRLERRIEILEGEVKDLKASLKSLKRKFSQLSSANSEEHVPSGNSSESTTTPSTIGVERLLKTVEHIKGSSDKEINECVRRIVLTAFTTHDLISCSRTGKKTFHSPGENPRPALDQEKMRMVEQAVATKCSISTDIVRKKFDNVVKMIRRSNTKASSSN